MWRHVVTDRERKSAWHTTTDCKLSTSLASPLEKVAQWKR